MDPALSELEAPIDADPASEPAWRALLEALSACGAPRGALGTAQLERERARRRARRAELDAHAAALLDAHAAVLLPPLATHPSVGFACTWRGGFWRGVRLANRYGTTDAPAGAALLAQVLAHRSARFLEELTLGEFDSAAGSRQYAPLVAQLVAQPGLATLRRLALAPDLPRTEGAPARAGDLRALPARFPALAALHVGPIDAAVSDLSFAALRELTVETRADGALVDALAAAPQPQLTDLALTLPITVRHDAPDPACAALVALLRPARFPALRRLSLLHASAAVFAALGSAGLIPQLASLALQYGDVPPGFAQSPGLETLASLDVSGCTATREELAALRKRAPGLIARNVRYVDGL